MLVAVEEPLAVAGDGRELDDLARVGQPLRGRCAARAAPDSAAVSADAIVTGSPIRRAIWIASSISTSRRARVGPWRSAAARRESSRTRSALSAVPDDRDPLLQQRDEAVVGEPVASTGSARRSPRWRARAARKPARPGRRPRRAGTSPSRARHRPRRRLRVAERQQQLAALRGGRCAAARAPRAPARTGAPPPRTRSSAIARAPARRGVVDRLGRPRRPRRSGARARRDAGPGRPRGRPPAPRPTRRCSSTRRARVRRW